MSNLRKNSKLTVAILTALLIIAIAAPLASFATAAGAATATLGTVSGPNGTLVKVSGTGFVASEAVGAITITVDGLSGKAITTSTGSAVIDPAYRLSTDANGVLTGYIIIYGLSAGAHTVIISDASTNVVAGTFTITNPTVTVTSSTVSAGSSVTVTGSGYPVVNSTIETTFTNTISSATFAGSPAITVASGKTTGTATTLSSNVISSAGAYTGTVSLPAIVSGSAFTLTDSWSNTATSTLTLATPTVTLSPSSGPVGTVVTATITGFGPSTTVASVKVGNVATALSTATFVGSATSTAATTEQGTTTFLFTIPAGTTTTLAGVSGAQAVTVADALGNVGTATFTVTPKVTITTGTAATDSGTLYVPVSTVANLRIAVSGFKASSALTISASPGVPSEWITPTSSWSPNTQITSGVLYTDANGAVASTATAVDTSSDYPTAVGQYIVTISDGTNSVTTTINVVAAGDILAATTTSGAAAQSGVQIKFFSTAGNTPTTVTLGGLSCTPAGLGAGSAWPTAVTASFTVAPTSSAGVHTLALTGGGSAFNTVAFTTVSPSVTVISPSSAAVGTTVTVVGTGFASAASVLAIQGATVAAASNVYVASNNVITTFVVPNYVAGTYTLSVSDGTNVATTTITITAPAVQITPTTSTLGTATIGITGSGFKSGDSLTVKFDTTTITGTYTGLTATNTNGGILLLSGYAIPTSTTAGAHTVYVIDASTGAYATATFTVTPKLTAPSAAVRPGAQVAVTGIGFAASSIESLTINGTATNWVIVSTTPVTSITQTSVVTGTTGDLYTTSSVGFVVSSTQASGVLVVTVTDAAGNTATVNLTVLSTPAIAIGASNIVAGTITTGVSITGTGFTPGSRTLTANIYSGSTLVAAAAITGGSVTVRSNGSFTLADGVSFKVPASVVAGTYTLRVSIATPTETADAALTVLGAPTLVAPTTAASGSNVTISVTGLSKITDATFSSAALVTGSVIQTVSSVNQFGAIAIPATGANAFTTTTWFIVPTGVFAGTYLLTLTDSSTSLTVQTAITVQPTIAVTPSTGIKGTTGVTITGTGFAANPATVSAKLNGQAITLSTTAITATGGITPTFTVPITALGTNTLTVTDSAGNTASTTFTLTVPTLTVSPTTAAAGSTVQIIGSGYTAGSSIVIQVGGQIVTTTPAALTATGGSFIGYVAVPTGLSGNVTITATDSANNVGTAYLTVGTSSGSGVPSQTTMTSTAQTTTTSGVATTTFTSGSTVKAGFMLQSTSGSRDVVVAVTFQQGAKVYNMASFATTMDTTARAVSFTNLVPTGATGTWTATLQVFASDGTTPLGVTTLTFTVS